MFVFKFGVYKRELVCQCFLQDVMASTVYIVSRQLLIYNHKMELTKFEIRVLLKHYCKQDYKAAAAGRICEMEGESIVSERVAQRRLQRFNTGEESTKYIPRS